MAAELAARTLTFYEADFDKMGNHDFSDAMEY
jgi:hypothetical protein